MPYNKFHCQGLRWTCLFVFLEHVSGYLFYHEEVTTTACVSEQCLQFGWVTNKEETLSMIQLSTLIPQLNRMRHRTAFLTYSTLC